MPDSPLRSMTGFGRGTARAGATEATVEVRAVNGRYAEVQVRAPRLLGEHETAIQAAVKAAIDRGNATVHVSLDRAAAEAGLRVDPEAAAAAARLLESVRDAAGLSPEEAPVTLADLVKVPGVLTETAADAEAERAEAWAAARAALAEALGRLDAMRRAEGAALADALAGHADALLAHTAAIETRAPARVEAHRARLRDRLEEMLADDRLDRSRLETDLALLADKLDVTEETVRLRSHVGQFREALAADEPVGRRLTFIAQEMNREANTVASKAQDPELAAHAVGMKEALEKIREQVANVV